MAWFGFNRNRGFRRFGRQNYGQRRYNNYRGGFRRFNNYGGGFRRFNNFGGGFRRFNNRGGGFRRFNNFRRGPPRFTKFQAIQRWGPKFRIVSSSGTQTGLGNWAYAVSPVGSHILVWNPVRAKLYSKRYSKRAMMFYEKWNDGLGGSTGLKYLITFNSKTRKYLGHRYQVLLSDEYKNSWTFMPTIQIAADKRAMGVNAPGQIPHHQTPRSARQLAFQQGVEEDMEESPV